MSGGLRSQPAALPTRLLRSLHILQLPAPWSCALRSPDPAFHPARREYLFFQRSRSAENTRAFFRETMVNVTEVGGSSQQRWGGA